MNHLRPLPEDPRLEIGGICEATVLVASLADSVAAYSRGLGWEVISNPQTLGAYDAGVLHPDLYGCSFARLAPSQPSASPAGVRLIEVPGITRLKPLRTHGWTALEVGVVDVQTATKQAVAAGWEVLFEPVKLGGGALALVAAQLAGPSGECVYLTQILGEVAGFELPQPVQEVDGIFIAVLGASSLEESRSVLENRFNVRRASDRELPVQVVNQQYGFPSQTLHRISSLQLPSRTCIEVDQLPSQAVPRLQMGKAVAAGILSIALTAPQAMSSERLVLPDGALIELRRSMSGP